LNKDNSGAISSDATTADIIEQCESAAGQTAAEVVG